MNLFAYLIGLAALLAGSALGQVTRLPGESGGPSPAVIVKRGNLVHTKQWLASDGESFGDLMERLSARLQAHGAGPDEVVKLNVYVGSAEDVAVEAAWTGIREAFAEGRRPAVTLISTPLPEGASMGMDAVFLSKRDVEPSVIREGEDTAVAPAGRDLLQISGRAAKAETLGEATRGTMAELLAVMAELGGKPADVVQVKAFLQPMSDWASADREIRTAFGDEAVPPVVYVEWTSTGLPTEIEMIAAAPERMDTKETVSYFTPTGDKASPVFSRVARIHGDTVIYMGSLIGPESSTAETEVKGAFDRLGELLKQTGSDFRHLAKATYYVSDDAASKAHNAIRPTLFDPARPPAASKITLRTVGGKGNGLLMDFIVVPVSHP
ncbi:MAG: RidA family protein [Verrucomicrobiae bacterium]|nr:RidA family protein [Verrucomicrobiae bacterium]